MNKTFGSSDNSNSFNRDFPPGRYTDLERARLANYDPKRYDYMTALNKSSKSSLSNQSFNSRLVSGMNKNSDHLLTQQVNIPSLKNSINLRSKKATQLKRPEHCNDSHIDKGRLQSMVNKNNGKSFSGISLNLSERNSEKSSNVKSNSIEYAHIIERLSVSNPSQFFMEEEDDNKKALNLKSQAVNMKKSKIDLSSAAQGSKQHSTNNYYLNFYISK